MRNKFLGVLIVSGFSLSSVFAMEITAADNMMKDKKVEGAEMMKKVDAAMVKDKMMDGKMEDNMMMTDEMYTMIKTNSTKSDISKLQMMLVEKGYLKMPKGVAYGYYGKLTKASFAKYKSMKMEMKDSVMKAGDMKKMDDKMMKATSTSSN